VLLDGGLADPQLLRDRLRGGGLREHLRAGHRREQRDEDVLLAGRELRRGRLGLGHAGVVGGAVGAQDDAGATDAQLVAGADPRLAGHPVAVDERAVAGADVADAPPAAEPLEDGVHAGDLAIVAQHDVVARSPTHGDAVTAQRHQVGTGRAPHLQERRHHTPLHRNGNAAPVPPDIARTSL
jgi:hypothetical protein